MSYIQVHILFKSNSKLISLQFQVKTQSRWFKYHALAPTHGSNPGLLHCRRILYQMSYQGSPLRFGQRVLILKLDESSCSCDILSKDCIAWWRDSLSEPKTNTGKIQQIIHNFYCWLFPQKSKLVSGIWLHSAEEIVPRDAYINNYVQEYLLFSF